MSHRLLVSFLLVFALTSILGAIMQGGGGIVSTVLADDISANSTFIPATGTSLFASTDIITIGAEDILYDSTNSTGFFADTRGYAGTTAAAHTSGSRIYSQEAGVLNNALGFNVAVELQTGGYMGVIMLPINFLTKTIPHAIMLNAGFLQIPELAIIGILWMIAGIALLVELAIVIAPIAISAISAISGFLRR